METLEHFFFLQMAGCLIWSIKVSKTRNLLLFVINITKLSVILYLISINWFQILILKLVPLILENVKILNFVINQRVILSLVTGRI